MSQRLFDEIARMAPAHLNAARTEITRQQLLHQTRVVMQVALAAEILEDLNEICLGRAFAEHLVVDSPKEGFVDELGRPDVGREHDQHHEREIKFLSGLERQEIDAAFERDDPAIQQVARRTVLSPEVIDDQYPAIGPRLNWRGVKAGGIGVGEIERLQRQLAAYHHHRPTTPDPSRVAPPSDGENGGVDIPVVIKPLMIHRIVELDDLTLDLQCMRNRNFAVLEMTDGLRDHSLAVARRAVDEHRMPCRDRRTDLIENLLTDDQV